MAKLGATPLLYSHAEESTASKRPSTPPSRYSDPLAAIYNKDSKLSFLEQLVRALPSKLVAACLVDNFFSAAQANYYYVHEDTFRAKLDSVLSLSHQDLIFEWEFLLVALMVFALGCLTEYPTCHDACPGASYFRVVQQFLPYMLSQRSFESIQTCVMLAAYVISTESTEASHIYASLAIQMVITRGLHRSGRADDAVAQSAEIQRRVFWTAYIFERYEHPLYGPRYE